MINNPDIDSTTSADNAQSANEGTAPLKVTHVIHYTNEMEPKPRALLAALELHGPKSALIACSEASECELLARYLMHYGFKTEFCTDEHNTQAVSPNLTKCAHNSDIIFICQSNLIDNHSLEKIPFLINYDMVQRPQVYEKLAQPSSKNPRVIANLITSKEFSLIAPIKAHCLIEFQEQTLPSSDEVLNLSAERLLKSLNHEAQHIELGQFESLAKRMLAKDDVLPALAMLLRHYLLKPSQAPKSEPSYREKREYSRQPMDRRREHSREPSHRQEPKEATHTEEKPKDDTGVTRLYITLGRQDNFHDLADLAQYLSAQSGVDLGHFSGSGMIRDTSAHIEVDSDVADQIISALHNSKKPDAPADQEGSMVVCERARQNTQRPTRRPPHKRHGHFQRR